MIDQIYNMLKDFDPMEQERVLKAVESKLEAARIQKVSSLKVELLKYEKR